MDRRGDGLPEGRAALNEQGLSGMDSGPASAMIAALKRIALARRLAHAGRAWLAARRIDLWVVSGAERFSGLPLVALLGGQRETVTFVRTMLFRAGTTERHECRWLRNLHRIIDRRTPRAAIVVLDTSDRHALVHLHDAGTLWLRGWVRTELELARAAERMRHGHGLKSDIHRLLANRLTFRVTRDPQALERFYWEMYRPYASAAFAGRAVFMTREQFWDGCRNAELLVVHRDEEALAAMVILYPPGGIPHWWVLGVRQGDRRLLADGALAALYYYGVQHLQAAGHTHAHLGGVRPFLADGVLQYKRKWGARLIPGDDGDPHWFMVKIEPTAAVREFLYACPLIGEDSEGLVGWTFGEEQNAAHAARLERQKAELAALGVTRVVTAPLSGAQPATGEWTPRRSCLRTRQPA